MIRIPQAILRRKREDAMRKRLYVIAGAAFLVLVAVVTAAVIVIGPSGSAKGTNAPRSTAVQPPAVQSATPQSVIGWAQSARSRWEAIRAVGETRTGSESQPFLIEVGASGEYICRDGGAILRGDGKANTGSSVTVGSLEAADPSARHAGEEQVVPSSLSDMIQPAYWIRKELGQEARKVEYLGAEGVNGREAYHLRAYFPSSTAKEASWDVYVDQATGVVTRFVINPLPGEQRYEQVITSLTVNPSFDANHFAQGSAKGAR